LFVQRIFLARKYTRYSARDENPLDEQWPDREFRESVTDAG